MNKTNREIKIYARELIRNSRPMPVFVAMLFAAFANVMQTIGALVLFRDVPDDIILGLQNAFLSADEATMMFYYNKMIPSGKASLLYMVLMAAVLMVSAGYTIFLIRTLRRDAPSYGNLLDGFGMLGRIVIMSLLKYVLVFIGLLLFVIPGIFFLYVYRYSFYILVEHPELSAVQCLKESRRMTKGFKMRCLWLDISFVLWYLAFSLPYIGFIALCFGLPFIRMSSLVLYDIRCHEMAAEELAENL